MHDSFRRSQPPPPRGGSDLRTRRLLRLVGIVFLFAFGGWLIDRGDAYTVRGIPADVFGGFVALLGVLGACG